MKTTFLLATLLGFSTVAYAQSGADDGGRYPKAYREHQEADATTQDVGYSAAGALLAVASYEMVGDERHGDIVVYDAATEKPRFRFDATAAFCAAISPDGSKLAAWVLGEGFVLRDLPDTSKHKVVLEDKQQNVVFKCAFSPDGKSIALAGFGGKVRIMDVATGKIVKELIANDHAALTIKVTYTKDGKLVTAGGDDVVRVWDVKTWKALRDITPPAGDSLLVSAVSEGTSRIVCAYRYNTYVYDLNTGKQLYKRDVGNFYNAAYATSGNLILLSSREGVFAFHKDLSSADKSGQGMPDIAWLAIDPKERTAAFATERQLITTDYGALVKLAGPLTSAADALMASVAPKQKVQPAAKEKIAAKPAEKPVGKALPKPPGNKCISGNCKNGVGKMRYADSSIYDGAWAGGKRQGMGTLTEAERSFTGQWNADEHADSGVYTFLHILHSENRAYAKDVRIGRVSDDKLNGEGILINYTMSMGKLDTQMMWKGHFVNDQLSGKGTWYLPQMVTAYSDSWTDNYHFNDGKTIQVKGGEVAEGSYALGIITAKGGAAASVQSSSSTSSSAASGSGGSMLDYGVFATKKQSLKIGDAKTYCFVSTCSGGGRTFKVLSKITADIAKYPFDQIKAEAAHRISNNGWYAQSSLDYVGTADEMHVSGTPGRDYVVSESTLYY